MGHQSEGGGGDEAEVKENVYPVVGRWGRGRCRDCGCCGLHASAGDEYYLRVENGVGLASLIFPLCSFSVLRCGGVLKRQYFI